MIACLEQRFHTMKTYFHIARISPRSVSWTGASHRPRVSFTTGVVLIEVLRLHSPTYVLDLFSTSSSTDPRRPPRPPPLVRLRRRRRLLVRRLQRLRHPARPRLLHRRRTSPSAGAVLGRPRLSSLPVSWNNVRCELWCYLRAATVHVWWRGAGGIIGWRGRVGG